VVTGKIEILDIIEKTIREIGFGSVTLIIQDSRLIQMNKLEKVRFVGHDKKDNPKTLPKPAGQSIKDKITKALADLKYGQVTFVIKEGSIVQIERTEAQRINPLQGVNGDGI
jgi:hypothetical protein